MCLPANFILMKPVSVCVCVPSSPVGLKLTESLQLSGLLRYRTNARSCYDHACRVISICCWSSNKIVNNQQNSPHTHTHRTTGGRFGWAQLTGELSKRILEHSPPGKQDIQKQTATGDRNAERQAEACVP